jgi:outer membrane protein insertion porin family
MHAKQTLVVASILLASVAELRAEDRTGTFQIGAGYRTDDSFTANAVVAKEGLFGPDSRFAFEAMVNARRQKMGVVVEDGSLLGSDLGLRFEAYRDDRNLPGFRREATGGSLELRREIMTDVSAFVGYRMETVAAAYDKGERRYRVGTLTTGVEYATADTRVGFALSTSNRRLGSQVDQSRFDTWAAHREAAGPFILHVGARGSLFLEDPMINGKRVDSELIYFDGSNDIRGYAPGGLGGQRGGNMLWTARGELELPIVKRWGLSLVGWTDAGFMASDGYLETGASVGFGILWHSPIGPLRLDFAIPMVGAPGWVFGYDADR